MSNEIGKAATTLPSSVKAPSRVIRCTDLHPLWQKLLMTLLGLYFRPVMYLCTFSIWILAFRDLILGDTRPCYESDFFCHRTPKDVCSLGAGPGATHSGSNSLSLSSIFCRASEAAHTPDPDPN